MLRKEIPKRHTESPNSDQNQFSPKQYPYVAKRNGYEG